MKLPYLPSNAVSRDLISAFGGYNHTHSAGDGEFFDMKNLTGDCYPVLAPRKARALFRNTWMDENGEVQELAIKNPTGMILKEKFCYTDGSSVVIGNESFDLGLSVDADMLPKNLVSMGAYLLIFPDRAYINTADTTEHGRMFPEFTNKDTGKWLPFEIGICKKDGSYYENDGVPVRFYTGESISNPTEGMYRINKIHGSYRVEELSVSNLPLLWESVEDQGYFEICCSGIGSKAYNFSVGDVVTIHNKSTATSELTLNGEIYEFPKAKIVAVLEDRLILEGYVSFTGAVVEMDAGCTIRLFVSELCPPFFDHVVESNNRLFGCYYGKDADGKLVNELFASALGSFRDFRTVENIDTDSWSVPVGSDGPFTGAVTIGGYPYFFKERCYHKIYGAYPSQYQVVTTECKGIAKGSERSAVFVNDVLFYKSVDGVCYFDGSLPVEISQNLGMCRYADAVAGGCRNKYYISMRDIDTDEWSLFVYDTYKGMWHREDDLRAYAFCTVQRDLYCIPEGNGRILSLTGNGEPYESTVEWSFETGMISCETIDKKYLHRISVRMSLGLDTELGCFIEYDSCGTWEYMCRISDVAVGTFTLPITPRRCDHFRLRFAGKGDMKVFALAKSYSKGSDL